MLEAYSTNLAIAANVNIPFNSTTVLKGCTATHPSPDTFNLNKCGVYMVAVSVSAEANTTIQLYKDGVAQLQAQSTGDTPSFVTLVQVDKNNSCCPCSSPTTIQIMNSTATTVDANIVITKVV